MPVLGHSFTLIYPEVDTGVYIYPSYLVNILDLPCLRECFGDYENGNIVDCYFK